MSTCTGLRDEIRFDGLVDEARTIFQQLSPGYAFAARLHLRRAANFAVGPTFHLHQRLIGAGELSSSSLHDAKYHFAQTWTRTT